MVSPVQPQRWSVDSSGWACCSFNQRTRVTRYLDAVEVSHAPPVSEQRVHDEQRLYIASPSRERFKDVVVWTVNGTYRIEPDHEHRLLTFRTDTMVTTDPMFWCHVDGRWAIECSLYDPTIRADQPARLQGWSAQGLLLVDCTWIPQGSSNPTNDQIQSRVRWDGRVAVLDVNARTPFSLTVQTVQAGRFSEITHDHPMGLFEQRFEGWFSDYVGLCLSAQDYEEKHILVGRFGDGSGRWRFDPAEDVWTAPPSGSRYHHRSVVVPWRSSDRLDLFDLEALLDQGSLSQAHEIEWWVEDTLACDLDRLLAWSRARGIPSRAQVFGANATSAWWTLDPLDPVDVDRFRHAPPRAVVMLPFLDARTVSWERVQAAQRLAAERPDHSVFEASWWQADGDAWDPWDAVAYHRGAGDPAHGVGFMRPVPSDARSQLQERKRRLPRHPCNGCQEQRVCVQRTPFPMPTLPWATCGGWTKGPLMGEVHAAHDLTLPFPLAADRAV